MPMWWWSWAAMPPKRIRAVSSSSQRWRKPNLGERAKRITSGTIHGVGCLLGEHIHLVANPTHSASDTRVMNKLSPIERWRAQVDRLRSGVGLIYPGKSDKCQ